MLKLNFTVSIQSYLQLLSPVYLLCCSHMLSFSQCDIFSQLLPIWLYNNVYSISVTYTYSTVCNCSPQYTNCAVYICFPFHNMNIFPQLLYNCLFHYVTVRLHWIHTVLFTITLPEYCLCCLHILPFTMWYFFTITAHLTLQQCLQHIRNIYIQYCLQLLSPVYLLWCLHVLSFSQCEYFPAHYCTIV